MCHLLAQVLRKDQTCPLSISAHRVRFAQRLYATIVASTRSEHCPLPRFPVCLSPNSLSLQLILGYRLAHSYGWTSSNILWAIRIYQFHLSETDLMTVDVELQDAHGIESVEVSLNGQPHKISQSRTRGVFRQQFARPLWVLT